MPIADFFRIKSIFKADKEDDAVQQELYSELLYMVLTRAAAADSNLDSVEVSKIQAILESAIDKEVTASEVRTAAITSLYNDAPFEKYVRTAARKLNLERRLAVCDAVKQLLQSDGIVGVLEADFFNSVAGALELTPAELVGLRK